jgi:NAD(P)-dependent dehydrogenase (short-subunit alcohol dehydrogenase family)
MSPTLDFTGQKVIVIGGTSGMGYAVARHVLDGGGTAVVTGRTQSNADEAAAALSTHGQAVGLAADLADPLAVERLRATLAESPGGGARGDPPCRITAQEHT